MALKWLRDQFKHLKIILWAVVAVFVLLVFVDWGTGRQGSRAGGDYAVKVGDRVISQREFIDEMRRNEQQYRDLYGSQWEQVRKQLNLASQTAQQFVERSLQLDEAHKLGLRVSDKELQEEILSYPAFQRESGGFVGQATYQRILAANQMTPTAFEAKLKEDLLLRKLRELVQQGIFVSDAEVEERVRRTREVADFDAIEVRYEPLMGQVSVPDDEVVAYYNDHPDEFRRDEQRSIRYLLVDTARLRRLLPVDDSEIQSYYDQHTSDFMEEEKAHARHILFRVPPDATPEQRNQIQLKAESVAEMARKGADFAELAKKYSEDPGSKDNGGDLGWFARGRMVKEFEDAVFGHKPGDIVGPVKSQFGYHVIKVEGYQPARQRPLEEVRDQVRFRLLEGRATAEAESRAQALYERIRKEKPATDEAWQQIADSDEALTLNLSPPVSKDESVPGLGDDAGLTAAIFEAKPGEIGAPRATSRGWIVWQLKDVKPAGVPPLDEVRAQVAQMLTRRRAVQKAMEKASSLAAEWRSGADPDTLAAEVGATVVKARDHHQATAVPGGIGSAAGLDEAVFAAADNEVVGPVELPERGAVIAKVERVVRVEPAQLASEKDVVRTQLVNEKASQLLRSILNERRRDTVVAVNSELIERFAPQGS
jgi:peptidyl-prolyl cis-trans isomerase D